MSKFDLRDISERLTSSSDTEAVVFEFIGYLQAVQPDWKAAVTFYEVSQDSLVNVYERQGNRLIRREIALQVDQLPSRLVRKFFHPSAFFNQVKPRTMLSHWLKASPFYEPNHVEAPALRAVVPVADWQSCVCLPMTDRDDVLGMLVLASEKKNAFGSRIVEDLIPIKSVASLALSQHLHRAAWDIDGQSNARTAREAAAEFQERIRRLHEQNVELEEENRASSERLAALARDMELHEEQSSGHREELERVKTAVGALEEQTVLATEFLNQAYQDLDAAQTRLGEIERTLEFLRDVFRLLAREHDPDELRRTVVSWLCERFEVERCSLMLLDGAVDTLRIAAQRGIDPRVAGRVKVRVGQGVAGWVARTRKPLLVRVPEEVPLVTRTVKETYNSDSFISVPLIYNDRLIGVLNLSNKREGEPFGSIDLERALMAGTVMAISLGGQQTARRLAEAA